MVTPLMRIRVVLLIFAACLTVTAQTKMSVEQLVSFLRSSIKLKQEDKQVADYVKKIKLSNRLDARTIEELQGEGLGPKTVQALSALREASAGLPAGAGGRHGALPHRARRQDLAPCLHRRLARSRGFAVSFL